jgi:hypothetical protein
LDKNLKKNKPHKIRDFIKSSGFIPIVLFVFLCAVYAVSSFYSSPAPVIESISPEIGYPGDVLEIKGRHFRTPDRKLERSIIMKPSGSAVYIARTRLVLSDFIYWSDEKIRVKIPQEIESGPLWVENKNGTSNEVIFTNRKEIPQIISGPVDPGQPYISAVDPLNGGVGDVVTINGMNFGLERENANVLFTLTAPVNINRTEAAAANPAIKSSNLDFDYISWTDNEIRIKVPDGSTSGKMWVDTDRGVSNSIYFELDEKTGTKSYEQKRGYQIKYDVNVNVITGSDGNSLAFWIPGLTDTPEQRNIEYERNITPELENYNGTMLYRFFNLRDGDKKSIQHTAWFERYEVKTRVNSKKVTWNYDEDSKFFKEYTKSDDLVKVDDERIAAIYKRISRSSNPYLKARLIYNHVRRMKFAFSPGGKDVIDNFNHSAGDSYTYALMFTALARKAGLPSRPVAGYLVYDDKKTAKHFWAEFYINNYGWIPVDPALGDGAKFGDIPEVENPGDYYFGNLDSRHISFSKGVISIPFIAPYGKTVYKNKMYSLQKSYEEVSGNIGSYKSDWNDIKIIEWW